MQASTWRARFVVGVSVDVMPRVSVCHPNERFRTKGQSTSLPPSQCTTQGGGWHIIWGRRHISWSGDTFHGGGISLGWLTLVLTWLMAGGGIFQDCLAYTCIYCFVRLWSSAFDHSWILRNIFAFRYGPAQRRGPIQVLKVRGHSVTPSQKHNDCFCPKRFLFAWNSNQYVTKKRSLYINSLRSAVLCGKQIMIAGSWKLHPGACSHTPEGELNTRHPGFSYGLKFCRTIVTFSVAHMHICT